MVIWFVGISGSGKSTLGKMLDNYFKDNNKKSFIIDGDIVRDFFENDLGYSSDERKQNIKRILLAAHVLEQNGITPIVCNISPFESLREFARSKYNDYVQIYLNKDMNVARKSDVKDVYKNNMNNTPIVGIDMIFEEPSKSELVLNVDDEDELISLNKIIAYLDKKTL